MLSSYDPNHWNVTHGAGVTIQNVILNGYHTQTATVPSGVPVETHTYQGGNGYLACCPHEWPDPDGLVTAVEAHTGEQLSHYFGCYRMGTLTLHASP